MPFLASEGCFWPLTASITLEVKNNHAHVTTQRILNKFIGMKFSIECMVWPTISLLDFLQILPRTINRVRTYMAVFHIKIVHTYAKRTRCNVGIPPAFSEYLHYWNFALVELASTKDNRVLTWQYSTSGLCTLYAKRTRRNFGIASAFSEYSYYLNFALVKFALTKDIRILTWQYSTSGLCTL